MEDNKILSLAVRELATNLGYPKQQSQLEGRVHKTELQKQKQSPGENHFWLAQPALFFTYKHGALESVEIQKGSDKRSTYLKWKQS